MKLLVNGQEMSMEEGITFGRALQAIEGRHVGDQEVISVILVDDEPLTPERLYLWKDRGVEEFQQVRVETKSRSSFAAEGLRLISQVLSESATQRDEIVEHLGQGRSERALKMLPEYLQVWNAVQQNLGSAVRLMDLEIESLEVFDRQGSGTPGTWPVSEAVDKLSEHLGQVKSALEAGDLVLLGDILDYEFSDLSEEWQDMLRQLADQFEPQE